MLCLDPRHALPKAMHNYAYSPDAGEGGRDYRVRGLTEGNTLLDH